MRILSASLLALAFLVPVVRAQDAKLKTTIVTYAPGVLPTGLTAFFQNGGEILPFSANPGGLGDPIKYEGPKKFVLRESIAEFGVPPEKMKPPIGVVDLPANCNNILLLAVDAGGGKLRLIPYDVASENLKPGEYKIFNLSHSSVSMIMGPQKLTLAPSENKMVRDPGWNTEPKVFTWKTFVNKDGKAPEKVSEMMWEHYPQNRNLIFLFNGRRVGEPIGMMSFNVEPPLKFEAAAQQ